MAFDAISSNIDEVLFIKPFTNVFVLGGFNVHDKELVNYSGGTDRHGELLQFFNLKWSYSQGLFYHTDPWLWLSQYCCYGFICFYH